VLGTEGVEEAGGGTRGVESPADSVPVCELFVRVRLRVLSPPDAELPPKPPLGCRRFIGPCDGLSERLIPMDGAERIAAWLRLAPMDPWPMLPPIDPWLAPPPIEPWPALPPWPPASSVLEGAIRIIAAMQMQVFKE